MVRGLRNRRRRTARRLVFLVLAALTTMTGVAVASLTYRHYSSTLDPTSQQAFHKDCASGSNVTGGGVLLDTDAWDAHITSLEPFDGVDSDSAKDDSWRAWARNVTDMEMDIIVYAICSGSTFERVSASRTVPYGFDTKKKTAYCPSGTSVVGGGVRISGSGSPRMLSSYPNSDHDGWVGITPASGSGSTPEPTMTTYAICATSGSYEYRRAGVDIKAQGVQKEQGVYCPSGTRVIGGGVKLTQPSPWASYFQSGFPVDRDADSDEDDGWIVSGFATGSASGPYPRLTAHVICKD